MDENWLNVWRARTDLKTAFPEVANGDTTNFERWTKTYGPVEYPNGPMPSAAEKIVAATLAAPAPVAAPISKPAEQPKTTVPRPLPPAAPVVIEKKVQQPKLPAVSKMTYTELWTEAKKLNYNGRRDRSSIESYLKSKGYPA